MPGTLYTVDSNILGGMVFTVQNANNDSFQDFLDELRGYMKQSPHEFASVAKQMRVLRATDDIMGFHTRSKVDGKLKSHVFSKSSVVNGVALYYWRTVEFHEGWSLQGIVGVATLTIAAGVISGGGVFLCTTATALNSAVAGAVVGTTAGGGMTVWDLLIVPQNLEKYFIEENKKQQQQLIQMAKARKSLN